ncbi:MAG: ParB/RepB/Spo0J family partition protein [Acidobacteriota bacterium]|jgi:ParB family chromosome partitioning protein|nr:ParB/RepB/Spo0J family partition protein [Acidobacteriota bacterium]
MSRKVLGRGLSALIGEDTSNSKGEELLEIDLDLIEPNSEQPRTRFTEINLEELAQSIRANGVVQPIVVRRRGLKYQLVAGERRWRASQIAGLQKIPAMVKEVADEKLLELALIENIQRQELNAIEEAKAYKKLIETVGLTQEMLAERVGKNRTVITTFLRLLKLPDDVQKLVEEEKITAGHGRALLMIDDADKQRRVANSIIEMTLSVRETEKAVKRLAKDDSETAVRKQVASKIDANVKAAETKLRRRFSTQVNIVPDGKGTGGKIGLEYYSESDLDRIFQIMMGEN